MIKPGLRSHKKLFGIKIDANSVNLPGVLVYPLEFAT